MPAGEFRDAPPLLERQVAGQIGREQVPTGVDGWQNALVLEKRSVEQPVELVDRLLDRLFTA